MIGLSAGTIVFVAATMAVLWVAGWISRKEPYDPFSGIVCIASLVGAIIFICLASAFAWVLLCSLFD